MAADPVLHRSRKPMTLIPDWADQYDIAQYQYVPFVEPEVGKRFSIQYCHTLSEYSRPIPRDVTVLAIFDELVVVRFDQPTEDATGVLRTEAAVDRKMRFVALHRAEMTAATDPDTPVEELSTPDL